MCILNGFKYCGNKPDVCVFPLCCSVLYENLTAEGISDYYARIREKPLSGTAGGRAGRKNMAHPAFLPYAFPYTPPKIGGRFHDIPIQVGGRWEGIPGIPPRAENRLYGKNGVSLHQFSGETQ